MLLNFSSKDSENIFIICSTKILINQHQISIFVWFYFRDWCEPESSLENIIFFFKWWIWSQIIIIVSKQSLLLFLICTSRVFEVYQYSTIHLSIFFSLCFLYNCLQRSNCWSIKKWICQEDWSIGYTDQDKQLCTIKSKCLQKPHFKRLQ